jgi:hypothetical protein
VYKTLKGTEKKDDATGSVGRYQTSIGWLNKRKKKKRLVINDRHHGKGEICVDDMCTGREKEGM